MLALKDNCNEKVEENQRYDKHKTDEVNVGKGRATSIYPISLLLLVSLIILALEENSTLSTTIVHNVLPSFACRDSEQGNQS